MKKDWNSIKSLIGDKEVTVTRIEIDNEELALEGRFELPPLAKLSHDDQIFVAMFVKLHGSIREMERQFGVSYPTIKSRLNRIGEKLDFVEVESVSEIDKSSVLEKLDKGEISVDDAVNLLNEGDQNE